MLIYVVSGRHLFYASFIELIMYMFVISPCVIDFLLQATRSDRLFVEISYGQQRKIHTEAERRQFVKEEENGQKNPHYHQFLVFFIFYLIYQNICKLTCNSFLQAQI